MSLLVDIEKDYGGFHLCSRFETNGGITGLLGASGCGKSQTLRCIAGVQTPDQGRIVLDGVTLYDSEQHINLTPQQRGVGYLFQSYALFPNMTVRANILTGLRREKDAAKKQAAFEHAIHLLKLEGLEDRRPAQLSGGQAQRVALARMLVSRSAPARPCCWTSRSRPSTATCGISCRWTCWPCWRISPAIWSS